MVSLVGLLVSSEEKVEEKGHEVKMSRYSLGWILFIVAMVLLLVAVYGRTKNKFNVAQSYGVLAVSGVFLVSGIYVLAGAST